MKDKILTLIVGILIGAIIATAGCTIYCKNKKPNIKERPGFSQDGGRIPNVDGEEFKGGPRGSKKDQSSSTSKDAKTTTDQSTSKSKEKSKNVNTVNSLDTVNSNS